MENSEAIASKISQILDELPGAEDTVTVLEELRIAISAVSSNVLKEIVPNVSMNIIFGCIAQNDSEQVHLCCEILTKLLNSFHPITLLGEFEAEIIQGLILGTDDVRKMCLNQVLRIADEGPDDLVEHVDILLKSMHVLGHEDIAIGTIPRKISQAMGSSSRWPDVALSGVIHEELLSLLEQSSVVQYRVYEVVVDMAVRSETALMRCSESGILHKLMEELTTNDILSQLNCLELLSTLASCNHGLRYIVDRGVVKKLDSMFDNCQEDGMMVLLLPGLMKFFGQLARRNPRETCTRHARFLATVFRAVQGPDPILQPVAIETLAFVGQLPDGKVVLDSYGGGQAMKQALKTIGSVIADAPTELRSRALTSLYHLLDVPRTAAGTDEAAVLEITERWFRSHATKPLESVTRLSSQPFPEIRLAALRVLQALAKQQWGRLELNNHAGFNEYLLDRRTEKDKIGKDLKFEIIKTLLEAKDVDEIFGKPYVMKLKVFEREGPYFVRAQAEVAMESQS